MIKQYDKSPFSRFSESFLFLDLANVKFNRIIFLCLLIALSPIIAVCECEHSTIFKEVSCSNWPGCRFRTFVLGLGVLVPEEVAPILSVSGKSVIGLVECHAIDRVNYCIFAIINSVTYKAEIFIRVDQILV
jgi:hypothetical protein